MVKKIKQWSGIHMLICIITKSWSLLEGQSPLAHVCHVWSTSVSTFMSHRVYRTTDRRWSHNLRLVGGCNNRKIEITQNSSSSVDTFVHKKTSNNNSTKSNSRKFSTEWLEWSYAHVSAAKCIRTMISCITYLWCHPNSEHDIMNSSYLCMSVSLSELLGLILCSQVVYIWPQGTVPQFLSLRSLLYL